MLSYITGFGIYGIVYIVGALLMTATMAWNTYTLVKRNKSSMFPIKLFRETDIILIIFWPAVVVFILGYKVYAFFEKDYPQ